jgi:hypothetical protein
MWTVPALVTSTRWYSEVTCHTCCACDVPVLLQQQIVTVLLLPDYSVLRKHLRPALLVKQEDQI